MGYPIWNVKRVSGHHIRSLSKAYYPDKEKISNTNPVVKGALPSEEKTTKVTTEISGNINRTPVAVVGTADTLLAKGFFNDKEKSDGSNFMSEGSSVNSPVPAG